MSGYYLVKFLRSVGPVSGTPQEPDSQQNQPKMYPSARWPAKSARKCAQGPDGQAKQARKCAQVPYRQQNRPKMCPGAIVGQQNRPEHVPRCPNGQAKCAQVLCKIPKEIGSGSLCLGKSAPGAWCPRKYAPRSLLPGKIGPVRPATSK